MYTTQRSPLWGTINKHRLMIMLLITIAILSVWIHEQITEYKEIGQALSVTINEQVSTIKDVEAENSELKTYISELEDKILELEDKILEAPGEQETIITQDVVKKDFKSYMPHTAITDKSSKQYKLQQQASTDSDGIRCIDSRPMVAIGTGWGLGVGDIALITCENGNSFEAIIGDIKADIHTDSYNKTTMSNGCRCEFIVDMGSLNTTVKSRGNVAILNKYNGYVVEIVKI